MSYNPAEDADWKHLYEQEFSSTRINLNPGTLGTPSRSVRQAMASFWAEELHAFPLGQYQAGRAALQDVRVLAERLFGKPPAGALVVTQGATTSMLTQAGLLARHVRPTGGAPVRVLTSNHEHHGGLDAFSTDFRFQIVRLPDEALWNAGVLEAVVRAARPEILLLSQRTWTGGQRIPVEQIGAQVQQLSPTCWRIVDAAQSLGLEPPAWSEADVVVSSAHKWLSGPSGTGFTWLSERALEALVPLHPVVEPVDAEASGARLEQPGGQDFARYRGLKAGLELYERIGPAAAKMRSSLLAARLGGRVLEEAHRAGRRTAFVPETGSALLEEAPSHLQTAGVLAIECLDFDPYPVYTALNQVGIHTKCIKGSGLNRLRLGIPWYETWERLETAATALGRCLRRGEGQR